MLHKYIDVRLLYQLLSGSPRGTFWDIRYFHRIKWKMQGDAFLEIVVFNLKLQFCISSNRVIIRDNPAKSIGCVLED